MRIQDMIMRGEVVSEPLSSGEVERFRDAIKMRLEDANKTVNHNLTRLESAYHAVLNCALLALRIEGYRVAKGPRHHTVALESLEDTLGVAGSKIDYFLDLSRTRSLNLYEARPITDGDVAGAVVEAEELESILKSWLETRGF